MPGTGAFETWVIVPVFEPLSRFFSAMLGSMSSNAELNIFEPVMLQDLVGEGYELPSLPEVFTRVCAELEDENYSLEQVCETIQHDPAMTSRLLKLVNCNQDHADHQVLSIIDAVGQLGRERCRHLLLDTVVREMFGPGDNPAFSMQVFWQHSIRTALIARELAAECENPLDPEVMFTAGLLHDMGRLLLIERFPEQMLASEKIMIQRRIDQLSAELTQLGLTHTAVGEALMRHWGLPEVLVDCARYHHEPVHDGKYRHATHLVYLANRLSEYQPPGDQDETMAILDDIENWNMNRLSTVKIAHACRKTDALVFEVMESLGMVALDPEE